MEIPFFTPITSTPSDFTLVTGDNKEIPVHRIILSIASTVFHDMFSLPQPSDAHAKLHNKTVAMTCESLGTDSKRVEITENARTISLVLSLIYPTSFTLPPGIPLSVLSDALECAIKYDFEVAIIKLDEILILRAKEDKQEALLVYAIGCAYHQKIVIEGASRECLRIGFNELIDLMVKESIQQSYEAEETRVSLRDMKAQDFCRLLDFHRERQKTFVAIVCDSWKGNSSSDCEVHCPSCGSWHRSSVNFKEKLLDFLEKRGPSVDDLSIDQEAQVICNGFTCCTERALIAGNNLLQRIRREINDLPDIES